MIATCFHFKCCISFTIPVAVLVSEATERRNVGKYLWLDNRGDEDPGDICTKTYDGNVVGVTQCKLNMSHLYQVPEWCQVGQWL